MGCYLDLESVFMNLARYMLFKDENTDWVFQTSWSPPVIFIAGRPKAALLFWFFGDFRCGALLFMVIHLYINIKISKNSCKMLD